MAEVSLQFDFGQNWKDFSDAVLQPKQLDEAVKSLTDMFGKGEIMGKTFLDVGSGSGLFSIVAKKLGATKVMGIDINPKCAEAGKMNAERFSGPVDTPEFRVVSVLDESAMDSLEKYDIVYAWGSLHHTGDMYRAIDLVLRCVRPNGKLCLAIYRKHFTSPLWKGIKFLYNKSPEWLQKIWIIIFYPVIYIAKFMVTLKNPLKMKRGMNFYHDVVDWIGGYPYEYATEEGILDFVTRRNFQHIKTIPAHLPTGNHQYLFLKR